jgi:hypothetical protein
VRRDRRARLDEAPKAPWYPFPLVEIVILIALVMIVLGFVANGGKRPVLLAAGMSLGSLAAIELSIREHFAGYRSHSGLLAGVCTIAVETPLFFLVKDPAGFAVGLRLVVGVVVFGLAFHLLRRAFQRRTGGIGFRA